MIKAIAIDDEPLALEVIRSLAAKVPFLEVKAYFNDAFAAIDYLGKEQVDLLFLDIKMPDISGIELMESLQQKPLVIFTTAYAEHAVTSYELNALDYLLKPFAFTRFLKACNKAREQVLLKQKSVPVADSIFIKAGYDQIKIAFNELLYLEGAGNYMTFVLTDERKIMSRLTVGEVITLLPTDRFLRVHRSYIVNKDKVDKIERHQLHIGKNVVPVGGAFNAGSLTA